MFTGLIEEVGKILQITSSNEKISLKIGCSKILSDAKPGDSIAVNGVCLTISTLQATAFTADVMPVTFRKSNLQTLSKNTAINLERAVQANGRLGGHLVSGHVDSVGKIREISHHKNAVILKLSASDKTLRYLIEEASISLDGISLTIAYLQSDSLICSIIPHTFSQTNLRFKKCGDLINIEVDTLGKYLYHFLQRSDKNKLDRNFLAQHGF